MPADQFRGDLLGLEQRGDRLADLAALGVRAGYSMSSRARRSADRPLVSTAAAARSARPASPRSTATAISCSPTLAGPNSVL